METETNMFCSGNFHSDNYSIFFIFVFFNCQSWLKHRRNLGWLCNISGKTPSCKSDNFRFFHELQHCCRTCSGAAAGRRCVRKGGRCSSLNSQLLLRDPKTGNNRGESAHGAATRECATRARLEKNPGRHLVPVRRRWRQFFFFPSSRAKQVPALGRTPGGMSEPRRGPRLLDEVV